MTAVIIRMNWKKSVHSTAHMPAALAYAVVKTKQMMAPIHGEMPSEMVRIFTMAIVTQPMMMRLIGMARYSARKPRRTAARSPPYRSSANCTSVITPARRHRRAKKKTVRMPLITIFHHSQFPATPRLATSPVTASGVSAAKVVATIATPASHQGTLRPEMKYSSMFSPPRFVK